MSAPPQIDVKVIYGGSARRRRSRWSSSSVAIPAQRTAVLGLVNLFVAFGLYYGTWWYADPDLRVMLIMRTEFAGVDTDTVARGLIPDKAGQADVETRSAPAPALAKPPPVQGPTSKGKLFVATILGWEALSTLSILALALSAGTLVRRSGKRRWSWGIGISLLIVLVLLLWWLQGVWSQYGRFVPDLLRIAVGAAAALITLIGLQSGRFFRGATYSAAILLVLAATATTWGLYFGSQTNALGPQYATTGFLALAFGVHSLWGWVLLPLTARLPR